MKSYLLSILTAAVVAALVGILSPDGERKGLAKHLKLLTSLFLILVLIAPIGSLLSGLKELQQDWGTDGGTPSYEEESYREQTEHALENASTAYFTQMLTQMLEQEFSITSGEIRCKILWDRESDTLTPKSVTLILSGKAIWKDPRAMEEFVSELLGCTCVSAIE